MKIIRLSKNELTDIVRECVYRIYSKLPLYEYAHSRSAFIDRVDYVMPQIIVHWCLIRCARKTNKNLDNINHWKEEINGFLSSIGNLQLKGSNKVSKRLKAIYEAFGLMDYFNRPQVIKDLCNVKFGKEGFDVASNEAKETFKECFKSLEDIAKMIASYHFDDYANEYIESL